MADKILIDAQYEDEIRVAIANNNGELTYFDAEYKYHKTIRGNIYYAKIERIEQSIQAAFINYGDEKNGFLPVSEIHPDYYIKTCEKKNVKIQNVVKQGQMIIVQANKEQKGSKCPAFSTYLNLLGRYCILLTSNKLSGISSKIDNKQQFDDLLQNLDIPNGFGVIIRTASDGVRLLDIKRDFLYLTQTLSNIKSTAASLSEPAMLYEERNIVKRAIRDLYQKNVEQIVVQGVQVYKEVKNFVKIYAPRSRRNVVLHDSKVPIFVQYDVEEKIQQITDQRITMQSGGNIVINTTEALTAIDVNSAKMRHTNNISDTALTINLEAAKEIAHQIKLRDISGLIVIDFIDMQDKQHLKLVEKEFKEAMADDKAVVNILKISSLGLLELSRQRTQQSYIDSNFAQCPCCNGKGKIMAPEATAMNLVRQLEYFIHKEKAKSVVVYTSYDMALYFLNNKRDLIKLIEEQTQAIITFNPKHSFATTRYEFKVDAFMEDTEMNHTDPDMTQNATQTKQITEQNDGTKTPQRKKLRNKSKVKSHNAEE